MSSIMVSIKKLSTSKRAEIVRCLVEGCSIRSTCRMTGVSKNTVAKLLVDLGEVSRAYHDEHVRGLFCERIQADEIWSFVGCKEKAKKHGAGDWWTWTALDSDTKLIVAYAFGPRDAGTAYDFMADLAGRLLSRVQITTDGLAAYIDAVMDNFGAYVDYSQLVKLFGDEPRIKSAERKYSPSKITGCKKVWRCGDPDDKYVSTSHVERQNLTMRMSMRRYTRLTNAFSKKVENHEHMTALHFMYYNFCRVHQTLRCTPAMEAELSDHVWEVEELVGLLEAKETAIIGTEENKRGPYRKTQNSD